MSVKAIYTCDGCGKTIDHAAAAGDCGARHACSIDCARMIWSSWFESAVKRLEERVRETEAQVELTLDRRMTLHSNPTPLR